MTRDELRRMRNMQPDQPTDRSIGLLEEAALIQAAWHRAGFRQVRAWVDRATLKLRTNLRPGGLPPHG